MNNRWISVKEKLPEIGKTVLCGVENVGILLNLCEYTKKGFRPANDLRIDDRVTHWQELPPDPYETKKPIKELPNLPKSTENLSKIKNKDEWLNKVRGKDSKLEELEKWVDENRMKNEFEDSVYYPELKAKIQSLK